MSRNVHQESIIQRFFIMALTCAGLVAASAGNAQDYQETLEENALESPHQQNLDQDPRGEALEEDERESTHKPEIQELREDPREDALEEDKMEQP